VRFLIVFLLVACQRSRPEAVDAGPTILGAENTTVVRRERIASGPRVAGSLEPRARAAVRAEAGGSVLEVKAEVGDRVKKDQLLARLENTALVDARRSARSAVTAARQEVLVARRQAERAQTLQTAGAVAARDVEVAQSGLTAAQARLADAQARLASAEEQLEGTQVVSPIDGVIAERAVGQGDIVSVGAALFTIIDPSTMRLAASVPSSDLTALVPGAAVEFQVRGYGDQVFRGTIERVAPAAEPTSRQIPILVAIPNPGGRLIAGLFAEGRVAAAAHDGLVVPATALVESAGQTFVVKVTGGQVARVQVTVGLRDERAERVELLGGVVEGDILLTGPARDLTPGTPVDVDRPRG
jgi:membrane fusion protein, multidrug efflux system